MIFVTRTQILSDEPDHLELITNVKHFVAINGIKYSMKAIWSF